MVGDIEGDLLETYDKRVEKFGKRKADVKFIIDVLLLFRKDIIRPMEGHRRLNNYGMIKSYFKSATRNLLKNRIYSGINILGLTTSITACMLIMLYVDHALSYDKFFPNADRIYKLISERRYPSHFTKYSMAPHTLAKLIQQDFPEVETTTRLLGGPYQEIDVIVKTSDHEVKTFEERYFLYADSTFLDFFAIDLVKGDRQTALSRPHQI